ncbi:hypothetical protein [Lysinibacillus irui]|uniref:DUF4365 domain-containing protein n=1 Tax=Lysinibacillus irui TaxID=2998077 RepID=A0AAJ5UYG8_9BACI|nr:hypothetical protein [Lysinibacillus irui]WDV09402.1 hypothetical protein OU989_23075 [Lysinibacillus irui]
MATLNNSQIEALAVTAITTASVLHPLAPNIPIGDKGISFDGHIDVMINASEERTAFLGKVPIQVKGKEVEKFSKGVRNYSLNMDHYINFYKNNGAILFVVEVKTTGENKIFYKQLLPYELKFIITEYGHQKSRSIELRELEGTSLYEVCKRFLSEAELQPTNLIENNPFTTKDFTSFTVRSLTFNPKIDTNIEEHDFTFYGIVNNFHVPIGIGRLIETANEILETVIIDKQETIKVMVKIKKNESEKKTTFTFEDSLEIAIDNQSFTYEIKKYISVETQLKVLPILIAFLSEREIELEKTGLIFSEGLAQDSSTVSKLQSLQNDFIMLKEAFLRLNVDPSTKFINESNSFLSKVRHFVDLIVHNELTNLKTDSLDDYSLFNYDLDGLNFLLLKESSPTIHFISAFSGDILLKDPILEVKDAAGILIKSCRTSPYIKMKYQELIQYVNTDFVTLKNSFSLMNPIMEIETFDFVNSFCLNCINGYDETNRIEFLELVDYIYSLHTGGLGEDMESVIQINRLQVNLRLNGELSSEEFAEIVELKQTAINSELLFCTSVLLGSISEASFYFESFSNEYKEAYKKFPIYHLYKNMKH